MQRKILFSSSFPLSTLNQNYLLSPGWEVAVPEENSSAHKALSTPPGYFLVAIQLFLSWQQLQAGREESDEKRQGDKVFFTESKSNTSWSLIPTALERVEHPAVALDRCWARRFVTGSMRGMIGPHYLRKKLSVSVRTNKSFISCLLLLLHQLWNSLFLFS